MLFIGFAVSVGALAILIGRRQDLSPRDYQRIRWVIWGCLIGLPAYLLAQLSQETSVFSDLIGEGQTPGEVAGALSLVNGILCLFVVEAVRRPTVVNVWIPLRRATAFGLLLSVPVLFLHKQIEDDRPLHPHARLGLGRRCFGSRLPDRARARACDRTHGSPVRPQIHPRRARSPRGWRNRSALRQSDRDRATAGARAGAVASTGLGGFVSRRGRRFPPPPQRRMGRRRRRDARERPSPARRQVR